MTTNEQLVGIFLRPQDGVTVDENNWKQVVTYLKTSCDISVENFILCADNITYAFLIPQSQGKSYSSSYTATIALRTPCRISNVE